MAPQAANIRMDGFTVRGQTNQLGEAVISIGCIKYSIAVGFERDTQKTANLRLVVNNEGKTH